MMRMAAHYGKTLADFGDNMASPEFSEWIAFDRLYGFPDIYFLAAVLAPTIAGPWAKEPLTAADFVPYFAGAKQGTRDHMAAFAAMAARS